MENRIEGNLLEVKPTKQINEKFSVREFVLAVQGRVPQYVIIQAINKDCALLDRIDLGTKIECEIEIGGRKWTSPTGEVKYFVQLTATKVNAESYSQERYQTKAEILPTTERKKPEPYVENVDDGLSGLPF